MLSEKQKSNLEIVLILMVGSCYEETYGIEMTELLNFHYI